LELWSFLSLKFSFKKLFATLMFSPPRRSRCRSGEGMMPDSRTLKWWRNLGVYCTDLKLLSLVKCNKNNVYIFQFIYSHTGVNESINNLHNRYLPKNCFFGLVFSFFVLGEKNHEANFNFFKILTLHYSYFYIIRSPFTPSSFFLFWCYSFYLRYKFPLFSVRFMVPSKTKHRT
jgi:hypothetical protein